MYRERAEAIAAYLACLGVFLVVSVAPRVSATDIIAFLGS